MLNNFAKSKYGAVFLVMVLLLVLIAAGREVYRYYKVNKEISDLKQKIEDLKSSNEELLRIKEYFTSKEFLEDEARRKLNMTKAGESVIVISSENSAEEEIKTEEPQLKTPNFQLWWQYFFGQ